MPVNVPENDFDISSAAGKLIAQPLRHANLLPALIGKLSGPSLQVCADFGHCQYLAGVESAERLSLAILPLQGSAGARAIQALQLFFNDYHKAQSQVRRALYSEVWPPSLSGPSARGVVVAEPEDNSRLILREPRGCAPAVDTQAAELVPGAVDRAGSAGKATASPGQPVTSLSLGFSGPAASTQASSGDLQNGC